MRSEYEETLMKQRALFDEEIVALTEGMREEAKVCIILSCGSLFFNVIQNQENKLLTVI